MKETTAGHIPSHDQLMIDDQLHMTIRCCVLPAAESCAVVGPAVLAECNRTTGRGLEVQGTVRLDEEPLPSGAITFIPLQPGDPTGSPVVDIKSQLTIELSAASCAKPTDSARSRSRDSNR